MSAIDKARKAQERERQQKRPITLLEAAKKVNEYVSPHFYHDEELKVAWNLILGLLGLQV